MSAYIELNTASKKINNNNNKLFPEYFWTCIQNVVLFHSLLEDGKAASLKVPYLSLNEKKIGRARAPHQCEGLWKTDCRSWLFLLSPKPWMPSHPVFSDALLQQQSPGEPTAVQLQTGVPARHCTHTERSMLTNTSLSCPRSGYFLRIPASPSPLSCCLSWQGLTSSTAVPETTSEVRPTRHHLLAEQIQGDKPWKHLLQQCCLHNNRKRPTNNGPVEELPASANVAGIVLFVSFRKLPVEHWASCLTQPLDCSSPEPAPHPRHHQLYTKKFDKALDCQLNEAESKFAHACRQHLRHCRSSWSTDNR